MGSFSIWHFLVVFVIFGLPVLAIIKENTGQKIGRLVFFYWILIYIGAPFVINYVGFAIGVDNITRPLSFVFWIALIYPIYQRTVRRARDAHMGKMIAYLSIIPLVNVVTTLILLSKPSSGEARESE